MRQEEPEFTEEELFQTARLIVAAMIARIHTVEWTPALLSNDVLNVSMHNNWCAPGQAADRMAACAELACNLHAIGEIGRMHLVPHL